MRRWMIVLAGVGVAVALSTAACTAEEPAKSKPAADEKKADGKVVYTFKDQDELQQFTQFFRVKQDIITRLAVLQTYAAQEGANLEQINGQLFLKFKVDPNKSYSLDAEKRVLAERPTPPQTPEERPTNKP